MKIRWRLIEKVGVNFVRLKFILPRKLWRGDGATSKKMALSQHFDDFKNFQVSLIITLFISKLYNFHPYKTRKYIAKLLSVTLKHKKVSHSINSLSWDQDYLDTVKEF